MSRLTLFLITLAMLLVAPACSKERQTGENTHDGAQTTVETEGSKETAEDKDSQVKVRVRTPAGDFNVDVDKRAD